jgi:hypothetical protein
MEHCCRGISEIQVVVVQKSPRKFVLNVYHEVRTLCMKLMFIFLILNMIDCVTNVEL